MALKFLISLLVVTAMTRKEVDNYAIVKHCPLWACKIHPMRLCRSNSYCREGKIPQNCQVALFVILLLLCQFWGLVNQGTCELHALVMNYPLVIFGVDQACIFQYLQGSIYLAGIHYTAHTVQYIFLFPVWKTYSFILCC